MDWPWAVGPGNDDLGALATTSGAASACRFVWASVPGTSPWLGDAGSTFSTRVLGTGVPPGVSDWDLDGDLDEDPSGTTAISSGTASWVLIAYALVPGTSPCRGDSSTFSTLVIGTGESGASPSLASAKSSLSSFDDSSICISIGEYGGPWLGMLFAYLCREAPNLQALWISEEPQALGSSRGCWPLPLT